MAPVIDRGARSMVVLVGDRAVSDLEELIRNSSNPGIGRLLPFVTGDISQIEAMCVPELGSGLHDVGAVVLDMRGDWAQRFYNLYLNTYASKGNEKKKLQRRPKESGEHYRKRVVEQWGRWYVSSILDSVKRASNCAQTLALVDNGLQWNPMGFNGAIKLEKALTGVLEWEAKYREYSGVSTKSVLGNRAFSLGADGPGKVTQGVCYEALRVFSDDFSVSIHGRNPSRTEAFVRQLLSRFPSDSKQALEPRVAASKGFEYLLNHSVFFLGRKGDYQLKHIPKEDARNTEQALNTGGVYDAAIRLSEYNGLIMIATNTPEGNARIIEKASKDPDVWRRIVSVFPEPRRWENELLKRANSVFSKGGGWQPFQHGNYAEITNDWVVGPHSRMAVPLYSQLVLHVIAANGEHKYLRFSDKELNEEMTELVRRIGAINSAMFQEGFKTAYHHEKGANFEAGAAAVRVLKALYSGGMLTDCTVRYPEPVRGEYVYSAMPARWEVGPDGIPRIIRVFTQKDIPELTPAQFQQQALFGGRSGVFSEASRVAAALEATRDFYDTVDEHVRQYEGLLQVEIPIMEFLFPNQFALGCDDKGRYKLWETHLTITDGPYTIPPREKIFNPTKCGEVEQEIELIAADMRFVARMEEYYGTIIDSDDNVRAIGDHVLEHFRQVYVANLFSRVWQGNENEPSTRAALMQLNWLFAPEGEAFEERSGELVPSQNFDRRVQDLHEKAMTILAGARWSGETLVRDYGHMTDALAGYMSQLEQRGIPRQISSILSR